MANRNLKLTVLGKQDKSKWGKAFKKTTKGFSRKIRRKLCTSLIRYSAIQTIKLYRLECFTFTSTVWFFYVQTSMKIN